MVDQGNYIVAGASDSTLIVEDVFRMTYQTLECYKASTT